MWVYLGKASLDRSWGKLARMDYSNSSLSALWSRDFVATKVVWSIDDKVVLD